MKRIYTDRSRILAYQRCPRFRWLQYHEAGIGIVAKKMPLALAVGGAVHVGLAQLLNGAGEDAAVFAALVDFRRYAGELELDAVEQAALNTVVKTPEMAFTASLKQQASELGMDAAQFAGPSAEQRRSQFDAYFYGEQAALVEALVRAYARRRLPRLLQEFEVLEVEREGKWKLSEWKDYDADNEPVIHMVCETCGFQNAGGIECPKCHHTCHPETAKHELWFLSRPDALLRHRQSNELQLLSFKTTGAWDVRKARDIQHDMQGLTEGVEVERRLGEWWEAIHGAITHVHPEEAQRCTDIVDKIPLNIRQFLAAIPAPPRIAAIRYEFLLKGERWRDKELSTQLGMDCRSQRSPLIRQYVATSVPAKGTTAYRVGDVCWSWDFTRTEDQKPSTLAWQNWKSRPVWEQGSMAIRDWIDRLDRSELLMSGEDSTVGLAPRPLGWKSEAQAMGVTAEHPLDSVFVPPVTVYRNDDDLRDLIEEIEAQERNVAEAAARVQAASDPGEKRSLLNVLFSKHRGSCEYPSQCIYARERAGVCWAGAEMQAEPLAVGAGEYVKRTPNHPRELEK